MLSTAVRADDQALFRVVVTNSAGSTQSRQALLKVEAISSVTGEVVPSNWSKTLPPTDGHLAGFAGDGIGNFVDVSASGFVYYLNESEQRLDQYKSDGTLVRQIALPQPTAGFFYIEQVAVVEDPVTNDILIAVGRTIPSGSINSKLTAGGFIARYLAQSRQILFESSSITPGGLARDRDGRLYFMDLNTGALLRVGPSGENLEVLYSGERSPGAKPISFPFGLWANVAVAGDGTAYAKLEGGFTPRSRSVLRWRDGKSDSVDLLAGLSESTNAVYVGKGLGAYDGNVFALVRTEKNTLVRMLNADGTVSTVAGTPDSQGPTQFGSPGVLGQGSPWLGITSDGRVHLQTGTKDSRMFYDVQLRSKN